MNSVVPGEFSKLKQFYSSYSHDGNLMTILNGCCNSITSLFLPSMPLDDVISMPPSLVPSSSIAIYLLLIIF